MDDDADHSVSAAGIFVSGPRSQSPRRRGDGEDFRVDLSVLHASLRMACLERLSDAALCELDSTAAHGAFKRGRLGFGHESGISGGVKSLI